MQLDHRDLQGPAFLQRQQVPASSAGKNQLQSILQLLQLVCTGTQQQQQQQQQQITQGQRPTKARLSKASKQPQGKAKLACFQILQKGTWPR